MSSSLHPCIPRKPSRLKIARKVYRSLKISIPKTDNLYVHLSLFWQKAGPPKETMEGEFPRASQVGTEGAALCSGRGLGSKASSSPDVGVEGELRGRFPCPLSDGGPRGPLRSAVPLWVSFVLKTLVKISNCLNSVVKEGSSILLTNSAHPVNPGFTAEGIGWEDNRPSPNSSLRPGASCS